MSRRPRIGLTLELHDPIIAKVDERMREVIEGAGGVVVVIPHSADPESWRAAYEIVDAVVLMGGPGRVGRGLRRDAAPAHASPGTPASTPPSSASRAPACGTASRCSASAAATRC